MHLCLYWKLTQGLVEQIQPSIINNIYPLCIAGELEPFLADIMVGDRVRTTIRT